MKIKKEDFLLLEILATRIPEKKELVKVLEDILNIEREAIYRRLRGQVSFSLGEIAQICRRLDISVDNIIGLGTGYSRVRPVRIGFYDYINPTKSDYIHFESYVKSLKSMETSSDSEIIYAINCIPQVLFYPYEYLHKFYLLKWKYHQTNIPMGFKYADIVIDDEIIRISKDMVNSHTFANSITIIVDRKVFGNLVKDIRYFSTIGMIGKNDILLLKESILDLLDNLEKNMEKGLFFNRTPLNIYISNIHLEISHICVKINEQVKISMQKNFVSIDTSSIDHIVYDKMYTWMQSLIRTSTMVSGSGEFERMNFLKKQREIINRL